MAGDLYWGSVELALHMDDVGLTDVKAHTMTLNGGVTRSATQSKFGGYSAYFDGVDDELYNSGSISALTAGDFSAQLWCWPTAQVQTNPVVCGCGDFLIEFKPTGYPNGFCINVNGVRTACGSYNEDEWHYIFVTGSETSHSVYINGVFIATVGTVHRGGYFVIGSNFIGTAPDSPFKGYIDDARVTAGVARTDYSVPTAAFPEFLPDPEGVGSGVVTVTGSGTGIVAPVGVGSAAVLIGGEGVGEVLPCGRGSGLVKITGSGAGKFGRVGVGSGVVRVVGSGVASHGRTGVGSGVIRIRASGTCKIGVTGSGSGAVLMIGNAVGYTPLVPVGVGSGVVRIVGSGVAVGTPVLEDACP